jgi:rod shape-determining protein MreD
LNAVAREPRGAMIASALVALVLQVLPLPTLVAVARPAFLVVVVLYWSIAAPRAGGMTLGWVCGLILDAFEGSVLGQHAMAVALVTYLALRFHLQIRNRPILDQSLFAFAALTIYEFVVWAIDGWTGHPVGSGLRWVHPITGGLIWPVVVFVLGYGVSRR